MIYYNLHYLKFEKSKLLKIICKNLFSLSYANSGGRNNTGRTTAYHKGPKPFAKYAIVDRSRLFFFLCPGLYLSTRFVLKNRFLNLVCYDNGYINLIPAVEGVRSGDLVLNSFLPFFCLGSALSLNVIPIGFPLSSVSFLNSCLKSFSVSAGTFSKLLKKSNHYSVVELPSREKRLVYSFQSVILGRNAFSNLKKSLLKAGNNRKLGRRPVVRGVAMNPVDHPHGGGQGKTSGGQPSVSPWGVYTKGAKTSRSRLNRFRLLKRI